MIAMIGELFGAESMGQVYGHLHSYFHNNESATESLGIVLVHFFVRRTFIMVIIIIPSLLQPLGTICYERCLPSCEVCKKPLSLLTNTNS